MNEMTSEEIIEFKVEPLSTQNICGTLQEGFGNLYEVNSSGFNQVSENLETLNATLTSGINLSYFLNRE